MSNNRLHSSRVSQRARCRDPDIGSYYMQVKVCCRTAQDVYAMVVRSSYASEIYQSGLGLSGSALL